MSEETIFHKIVKGEAPCHKIWEDDNYLAFLSIFPNTKGFSVVVPKKFSPSYFADCPDETIQNLIVAAKKVAKLIDEKLEDVGRTGMILEGFGVDYLHVKLFPMHGTAGKTFEEVEASDVEKYFEEYEGYISSHDYKRADDKELAELAKMIRGE